MLTLTGKQVFAWGFALATAVAAGTWAIRHDHIANLSNRLKAVQKINKLDYPAYLEKISAATVSLQEHLDTLNSIGLLKEKNEALSSESLKLKSKVKSLTKAINDERNTHKIEVKSLNDEKEQKIQKLNKSLAASEEKLKDIFSDNTLVSLQEGEGTQFAGATVTAGFTKADLLNVCSVSINSQHLEMKPGDFVAVESLGRKCKVILEACKYGSSESVKFRFACPSQ